MKSIDIAYFAGLFDGEGCVSIQQVTRKVDTKSCKAGQTVTNMSLRISNYNSDPLFELGEKFGGTVRKDNPDRPRAYTWCATGNTAIEFARSILPYTRIKTGQLEIYLEFAELKRKKAMGTVKLSSTEIRERVKLIEKLRKTRVAEGGKVGLRLIEDTPLG